MAASNIEELIESFDLFADWEDRYRYLIDLGKRLTPMDEALKTEDRLVKGCTSRVWFDVQINKTNDGIECFHFLADSDAQIVKGLIYILILTYQDKPLSEIAAIDIADAFERLGLGAHLSPSRRNGFFAMVEYINNYADTAKAS